MTGAGPRLESIEILTPALRVEGDHWETHTHAEHELLTAISVSVTVAMAHAVFVVPRGAAIWIPAQCEHAVHAVAGNTMRCTWFAPALVPDALLAPTVLTVSSLLDAVLRHIESARDADPQRRGRAEAFVFDLLLQQAQGDDGLPQPRTSWLREVTDELAADPADSRTVEQWAQRCAVSVRTFTRCFLRETGTSFSRWRTRLRVQAAMASLSGGASVASVARRVGFESTGAFSTAFRRETGVAPREFAHGTRE